MGTEDFIYFCRELCLLAGWHPVCSSGKTISPAGILLSVQVRFWHLGYDRPRSRTSTLTFAWLGLKGLKRVDGVIACGALQTEYRAEKRNKGREREWTKETLEGKSGNKIERKRSERFKSWVRNSSLHIPPTCPVKDKHNLTQLLRQVQCQIVSSIILLFHFCFYSIDSRVWSQNRGKWLWSLRIVTGIK